MGKSVDFKISVDKSDEVLKAMKDQVLKALEECGLLAEGYAQVNLTEKKAVDTGNLRNSITHKVVPEEKAVYVGTNVEYAPYIEFGTGIHAEEGGRQTPWTYQDGNGEWHRTRGMKPRPYLRPALSEHEKVYKQVIEDELGTP